MLRYWNLLKYASNEGYEIFDFGRSTCDEGNYNANSPLIVQKRELGVAGVIARSRPYS